MAGKGQAVASGDALVRAVADLARRLDLDVREQVRVGQRVWGATRKIDLVLTHGASGRRLGVECKYQGGPGSAEEKIPATLQDIAAWPIPGLVVFAGEGFSANMRSFLVASGKAIALEDLEAWLRLFFALELR